jgi:hypothetical protein
VLEVVECLLCKHEALSTNPIPTKKKKGIKKGEQPAFHFFFLSFSYLILVFEAGSHYTAQV